MQNNLCFEKENILIYIIKKFKSDFDYKQSYKVKLRFFDALNVDFGSQNNYSLRTINIPFFKATNSKHVFKLLVH